VSLNWTFFSFDIERWRLVFGKANQTACSAILAAATSDDYILDDEGTKDPNPPSTDPRVRLARQMISQGIRYADLTPEDATTLDAIICSCFRSEYDNLVHPLLGIVNESNEFVNNRLVALIRQYSELGSGRYGRPVGFVGRILGKVEVTRPEHFLDFLCVGAEAPGRRLVSNEPIRGHSPYFILSPEEVKDCSLQLNQTIASSSTWPDRDIAMAAQMNIAEPLNRIASKMTWMAGCYG
jgi:hypothetical protein